MSFNLIGGTVAGAGNLVEFNGTGGIAVFGNPVSASRQPNASNAIEGNSTFENGRSFATAASAPTPLLGIDLSNGFLFPRDDGVTANDSQGHGAANDPNNFQNFPVLISATPVSGGTNVTGTLKGAPNSTFRIEFFANNHDPLNLPAEGQQFLGFLNVTTDANGVAAFSTNLTVKVAIGRIVTATATDGIGNTSEFSAGLAVTGIFAVGAGAGGGPEVKVYDALTGLIKFDFFAFAPTFTGGVSVAIGDVNGDGVPDIITGAGSGGGPHVKVFSGVDGHLLQSFFAYNSSFTGGVFVAAADVNGDGKADIVTGAGAGGGPEVRVFSGANNALLADFFAYAPIFGGGVRVAASDVNGDGHADIITGPGFSGGPEVKVISGATQGLIFDFDAFSASYTGGLTVAGGDLDGDGKAEMIVGQSQGSGALVRTFSGIDSHLLFAWPPKVATAMAWPMCSWERAQVSLPMCAPSTAPRSFNLAATSPRSTPASLAACSWDEKSRVRLSFRAKPHAARENSILGNLRLDPPEGSCQSSFSPLLAISSMGSSRAVCPVWAAFVRSSGRPT